MLRPRIGRRFEPPSGRQDVSPFVPVDVAGSDAMSVTLVTDHVGDPRAVLRLVPGLRRAVLLGDDFVRVPVVVHVGEDGKLDVEAGMDVGFLPFRIGKSNGDASEDAARWAGAGCAGRPHFPALTYRDFSTRRSSWRTR